MAATAESLPIAAAPIPEFVEEKRRDQNGNCTVQKYAIGKLLGKGGFAKCFLGTMLPSRQQYALKIVDKNTLIKSRAKQKSEIKIHRNLRHIHVVRFDRFFEDSNFAYMLLELCCNNSMSELLKRRKKLTEPEARFYLMQLINSLKYLHCHGIIHRDLKLGNLFLDNDMRVKVGDFGLATKLTHPDERKKTICGTPNYIAPEILEGKDGHSFEVDIWSSGVILYTLLVGKPPFESKDVKSTYKKILANSYNYPDPLVTPVGDTAKDLIRLMLQARPEHRPSLDAIINHSFFTHSTAYMPLSLPESALREPPPIPTPAEILISKHNKHFGSEKVGYGDENDPTAVNRGAMMPNTVEVNLKPAVGHVVTGASSVMRPRSNSTVATRVTGSHNAAAAGAPGVEMDIDDQSKASSCTSSSTVRRSARVAAVSSTSTTTSTASVSVTSRNAAFIESSSVSRSSASAVTKSSSVVSSSATSSTSAAAKKFDIYADHKAAGSASSSSSGSSSGGGGGGGGGGSGQKSAAPRLGSAMSSAPSGSKVTSSSGAASSSSSSSSSRYSSATKSSSSSSMRKHTDTATTEESHKPSAYSGPSTRNVEHIQQDLENIHLCEEHGTHGKQSGALSPAKSLSTKIVQQAWAWEEDEHDVFAGQTAAQPKAQVTNASASVTHKTVAHQHNHQSVQAPSSSSSSSHRRHDMHQSPEAHDSEPMSLGTPHDQIICCDPNRPPKGTLEAMHEILDTSFLNSNEQGTCKRSRGSAMSDMIALASHNIHDLVAKVWVVRYVDYTSKYGLGFLLNTGSAGVYFNDSTKIVLSADGNVFQYVERRVKDRGNGEGSEHIVQTHRISAYPLELQKKVTLLRHFRNYLLEQQKACGQDMENNGATAACDEAGPHILTAGSAQDSAVSGASADVPFGVSSVVYSASACNVNHGWGGGNKGSASARSVVSEDEMTFLKKWVRTRHAILFRLSNRTVQVVFFDRSEVLLSSEARVVTYVNKQGERTEHSLEEVLSTGRTDIAKRLKYTKDIMYRLINIQSK